MSTTSDARDVHEKSDASSPAEQQLQKRFEQAMQRRKRRHEQKDVIRPENIPDGDAADDSLGARKLPAHSDIEASSEVAEGISAAEEVEQDDMSPESSDGDLQRDPRNDRVEGVKSTPQSRWERSAAIADDNTVERNPRRRQGADVVRRQRTRRPVDRYSYEDEDEYEDRYSWSNPYDDETEYAEHDRGYSSPPDPECEWETYRSTSILFPPLDQGERDGAPTRPKSIIHFVGGTFFGSYPRKFYGTLLEDIARKCNAVVVATPIPLVLPGKGLVSKLENWMLDEGGIDDDWSRERGRRRRTPKQSTNPLDHLSLAETIQKEFNNAYRDVVLDEYCSDYASEEHVESFMKEVPIIGIGHSLGARIQAVSCSHPRISKRCLSMGKGSRLIRSGREGMIYLGFANWGASSSIPGVATLDRTVKRKRQGQRERNGRGVGRRDDVWDDRSPRRRRRYGRYDRSEAEDLDLTDVFSDVVTGVAKGAKQIGEALTPEAEDLEFSPAPDELWDDLSASDGWYSQSCQNNLIVQFDLDPIDQGSRLARTLLTAYSGEWNASNSADADGDRADSLHDVKFARLPGGHLTPVTVQEGVAKVLPRSAVSLLSSSYDFILDQLDGERAGKSTQRQRKERKDVADTVASYVDSLCSA
ncbi:hypothetical protein ACHAXT_004577 [Thalassiosira profunda]